MQIEICKKIQKILDENIYSKYNIPSFHIRKVETKEEHEIYIVYSLVSTTTYYGDGKPILSQRNIDINLYYKKASTSSLSLSNVLELIKSALVKNDFKLKDGEQDIPDSQGIYSGVNLEVFYLEGA